jgi:hypothetical protein
MQWRAYLNKAVPPLPSSSSSQTRARVDRAKARAFIGKLRAAVAAARAGACARGEPIDPNPYAVMMRQLVGSDQKPEVLWLATVETMLCERCWPGEPVDKAMCESASESIDDAEDWLRTAAG